MKRILSTSHLVVPSRVTLIVKTAQATTLRVRVGR